MRRSTMGTAALALIATTTFVTSAMAQDASRIKPQQVPPVRSQEEQRGTPAEVGAQATIQVHTFGGRGGSPTPPVDMSLPTPAPLSDAQLAAITETIGAMTAPGTLYARISASEPNATDRAVLYFHNSTIAGGSQGWAKFGGLGVSHTGWAVLFIHAPSARDFLVDCAVTGGGKFGVQGPSSTQTFDFGEASEATHIVFILQAAEPGWYKFEIEQIEPKEDPDPADISDFLADDPAWRLYACEITNL